LFFTIFGPFVSLSPVLKYVEFRILIKISGLIPDSLTSVMPSDIAHAIKAIFKFNANLIAFAEPSTFPM
jgi:hypothetical protein